MITGCTDLSRNFHGPWSELEHPGTFSPVDEELHGNRLQQTQPRYVDIPGYKIPARLWQPLSGSKQNF